MEDKQQLDNIFHYLMETFIESGNAHYTEIANKFDVIQIASAFGGTLIF